MKVLTAGERLAVAADVKDPEKVYKLIPAVREVGAYIKVNSILRAMGYGFIGDLRRRGVKVFADLKLFDIGNTLATDAALLRPFNPEILTVSASISIEAMRRIKEQLPQTRVFAVTVLTDCGNTTYCQSVHGTTGLDNAVIRLLQRARCGGLDGVVGSGREAALVKELHPEMMFIACGIRPSGYIFQNGDDQNVERVMDAGSAIRAGADLVVMGRPVLGSDDQRKVIFRAVEDIEEALL